ncbi:thioredoxin-like domain-containing protein [Syncephalis fuscata]|nr:thioredoxin-like domain-containing protein [Syncephalis fuscata]
MRFTPSAFLALVALAALIPDNVLAKKASTEEVTEADNLVQVLGKDNFTDAIKEDGAVTLVKFYAPWCQHCKNMAPESTDLCQEHGVQGYPTLKVFRESGTNDYRGGREAKDFVGYMKKQLLPEVSILKADDIEEFKDSDKVTVAAGLRDSFVFGATFDKKVAKKVDIKKAPAVTVFQKFDDGRVNYEGKKFNEEELESFVKANSLPLLNELGPENFMGYIESGKPLAYLFVTNDEEREKFGGALRPVAKDFKGKVNFVFIDAGQFGEHASTLNLKQEWPAFAIQEPTSQLKYPFDQDKEITGDNIQEFVQSYVDGKLKPSIKSEPIPEKNDEDVKVVVADNFDALVMDKTKDVLIEFYAPWCGHCKKLAPIYDKLAAKYKDYSDKITIVKMDATANDIPPSAGFTVEGFPTIKIVKAETNEVVEYEGDRTEESFIEFIQKNGHHKIELADKTEESSSEEAESKEEEKKTDSKKTKESKKTGESKKEEKTKEETKESEESERDEL